MTALPANQFIGNNDTDFLFLWARQWYSPSKALQKLLKSQPERLVRQALIRKTAFDPSSFTETDAGRTLNVIKQLSQEEKAE